jgi:hypothetical protein
MAMDAAVGSAITAASWPRVTGVMVSRKFLYMRAHWLRMPPHLLIPHLARKLLRKRQPSANR